VKGVNQAWMVCLYLRFQLAGRRDRAIPDAKFHPALAEAARHPIHRDGIPSDGRENEGAQERNSHGHLSLTNGIKFPKITRKLWERQFPDRFDALDAVFRYD
jgi:hypothetical protein